MDQTAALETLNERTFNMNILPRLEAGDKSLRRRPLSLDDAETVLDWAFSFDGEPGQLLGDSSSGTYIRGPSTDPINVVVGRGPHDVDAFSVIWVAGPAELRSSPVVRAELWTFEAARDRQPALI